MIKKENDQNPMGTAGGFWTFLDFGFRVCFGFRISDFGFIHPVLLGIILGTFVSSLAAGQVWENSLGMKFVSVPGTTVQFGVWETRVQDFAAFVQATKYDAGSAILVSDGERAVLRDGCNWQQPGFAQGPTHPVVGVNWEDAQAFCRWLTEKERRAGVLTERQRYRLPTDLEWSRAAGLENEPGRTPQERFLQVKGVYPWGMEWPPPKAAGNFAKSLAVDSFAKTAPVGSFAANPLGLHDLGGNVAEWCEDWWNDQQKFRVLRGAAWNLECSLCLMSSYRFPNFPTMRNDTYGFRVVLERN